MYDFIIAGAGPTGSSAAKALAERGCRVLLVEKFKMPRNKSCSGILIQKSIKLIREYFGEEVPETALCYPGSRGMVFTSEDGQEYRYEQEGLNIWRSSFDHWLAQMAASAGAELRQETTVLSCHEESGGVIVSLKGKQEYTEKARMVIACDGSAGSINQKRLQKSKGYVTTYQTFNRGIIDLDPHYFYAYLQPEFSEHDAWFNVKDDLLIFGVSVKDTGKIEQYYSNFMEYMTQRHGAKIEKQERSEKWIMPQVMPGFPIDYGSGRVLCAGEAAGFLNPMGEGISAGLESGRAAAEAAWQAGVHIHDQADWQAVCAAYEKNTQELRAYMKRQWQFVARLSHKFSYLNDNKAREKERHA